jgi:hypothetical protein
MPLKKLNVPIVLFGGIARRKGPQVSSLSRARISLPGVKPILARFEFTNHTTQGARKLPMDTSVLYPVDNGDSLASSSRLTPL